MVWTLRLSLMKKTSNGHNSGPGCPFDAIFFLISRIFSRSTRPNCLKAVCAYRFSEKRVLPILIRVETRLLRKKGIQAKWMCFSNRSRKNTKIQKKNCVKRTSERDVTAVWKFSTLKKEGGLEFGKLQTAITRASGVRLTRFFFWFHVFFRDLRNQTA